MFGFLIKKSFFDLWDNLFKVALVNIGFIVSLLVPVYIPTLLTAVPLLGMGVLLIGILWCFVYLQAAALSLKALSDYGNFGFADFFSNLKSSWPAGLVFGAIAFLGYILLTIVMPFYFGWGSMIGLFLWAIILWTVIVGILAFLFFFAIRSRLDMKITKVIKKSFIIFFDNPLFCVSSFFLSLVILVLSLITALLFPGPAGILLFLDEGLRLRLLKYDWLDVNPDANRRKIPWDALLIDEREKTGTRSFKNFIFPWKD